MRRSVNNYSFGKRVYLGDEYYWNNLHPYTIRILRAAKNNQILIPNWNFVQIINDLVIDFINIGFWDLLDTFYLFFGGENSVKEFKAINWINPNIIGEFKGNDLTNAFPIMGLESNIAGSGYNADAIYFRTNYVIGLSDAKYQLNDACLGTLVFREANNIRGDQTTYISSNNSGRLPSLTPVPISFQRLNSHITSTTLDFSGTGLMVFNRTDSTNVNGINKNVQLDKILNSVSMPNGNIFTALHMGSLESTGAQYNSDAGLSLMFTGKSVPYSITQLLREVLNEKCFRQFGLTEIA